MKILRKKNVFLSHVPLKPKMWFLHQKVCPLAQTDGVNTEDTLSGFQEFFLQPIIKDWSNDFGHYRVWGPEKDLNPPFLFHVRNST